MKSCQRSAFSYQHLGFDAKDVWMLLSRASRTALVAAAGALLLAGCGRGAGRAPAGGPVDLGGSGRGNANASIAAEGIFVAVVWGAAPEQGATDIYLATS